MRRVYLCDPSKNAECRKTSCQIDCFYTTHKEFEQKYISESRLTTLEEEIKKFRSIAETANIRFINKETGEEVKFVSESKVKKVITKIEKLKKHYPCFAECANACVEIIEEGLSIDE